MAQTVDSRGPTGRRGCLYARTKPEPQSLTPKDRFSKDSRSRVVHVLAVFNCNMRAKQFIEHFGGLCLRTLCICHSLFDADNFVAFGALAEAMTSAVHLYPWSQPPHVGQFGRSHVP